jgi:hypothetical protein
MYFDFPEETMAYSADKSGSFGQYLWGSDMVVSPVVAAADNITFMTNHTFWVPPGSWLEVEAGKVRDGGSSGGKVVSKNFDITSIPRLVRGGAVVPSVPVVAGKTIGRAARAYEALIFSIYPNSAAGRQHVYEDDGVTMDYAKGAFARIEMAYTRSSSKNTVTCLFNTTGSYPGMPTERSYTVRLPNSPLPSMVTLGDGKGGSAPGVFAWSMWGGASTWHYDGVAMELVIELGVHPAEVGELTITYAAGKEVSFGGDVAMSQGMKGAIRLAQLAKHNLDETRQTPGAHQDGVSFIALAAGAGDSLTHLAGQPVAFQAVLDNYWGHFNSAILELSALPTTGKDAVNKDRLANCVALLKSALI